MRKMTMAAACLTLAAGLAARAADPAPAKPATDRQQMIEMHQKMAELHRKAAECLMAGKDVKECHDAMVKECPMTKTGACPFMGADCPMFGRGMKRGGRGRGMMRGQGPGAAPAAVPAVPAAPAATPAEQKKTGT